MNWTSRSLPGKQRGLLDGQGWSRGVAGGGPVGVAGRLCGRGQAVSWA